MWTPSVWTGGVFRQSYSQSGFIGRAGTARIGARNAKATETFYDGLKRVYDVGALVCAGWVQRVPVPAEQPCPAGNAVVNHNGGTRSNTRAQVWRQLLGHHHRRF